MRSFRVAEIFRAPQGEGFHIGRPAVFVRFAGCNLGHGKDRVLPADICQFCDTDFSESESLSPDAIVQRIVALTGRPRDATSECIVLTGGEPLLQVDESFVLSLHLAFPNARVHIETNGTVRPELQGLLLAHPDWLWVAVSPKRGAVLRWRVASEVKVVVPGVIAGEGWSPDTLEELRGRISAIEYWLVPQDSPDGSGVFRSMDLYFSCLERGWRFGVQAHKVWHTK